MIAALILLTASASEAQPASALFARNGSFTPKFGGSCSYGKRAGVGLAASFIGGAVAIGILFLPQPLNWTAALAPPLGAAIALKGC